MLGSGGWKGRLERAFWVDLDRGRFGLGGGGL